MAHRIGKTKRDRKNHSAQRNAANKAARAAWNNETTLKRSQGSFPFHTCNGKKNRHLVTGKGGNPQVLDIHQCMK